MKTLLLSSVLILSAVPALAGEPQTGVYLSTDMGGQMLVGRSGESWVDPDSHGQVGNTLFYGDTDTVGPLPAAFCAFMGSSCPTGTRTRGGWGSVTEAALRILGNCTVPTQDSTWSAVKSLYQ